MIFFTTEASGKYDHDQLFCFIAICFYLVTTWIRTQTARAPADLNAKQLMKAQSNIY